ncbi:MAG TPA: hypothetical protein VNO18_03400 [Xanthobacteraceae bacterium]|nr:hypothetical protein [Xanthobacteraceae bacterium]
MAVLAMTSPATPPTNFVGREAHSILARSVVLRVMLGGMGLFIGPIGLHLLWKHDSAMQDEPHLGMDGDSLAMLLTTSRKSEALIIAFTSHRG